MRPSTCSLCALILLAGAIVPAAAQTRSTWSLQGSALYSGLGGNAYSGIDAGPGFEVQARRKLSPVWSLGCGFQGTYHSLSAFSGDLKLQGGFCEPRRLVDINSESVFPYLSARASVLRQSLTSGAFKSSADGATINVGTGIMMPFGSSAGSFPTLLELGISAGYTWFGDFSATSGTGQGAVTGSTGGGWNYVLRVGIAVGLP